MREAQRIFGDDVGVDTRPIPDCGADSMDVVDLQCSVDRVYGIRSPDSVIDDATTVGDTARKFEKLLSGSNFYQP